MRKDGAGDRPARGGGQRPSAPFPYGRSVRRSLIALLGGGTTALAVAFAPLAFGRQQPLVGLLLGAVVLLGLALALVAVGAVGPSLDHHRRTGLYLVPAKGGTLETRYAAVLWLLLILFGGLGLSLAGLGLWALGRLAMGDLGG